MPFTFVKEHTRAVNEAFKICLQEGLIYRANRLVHWSPSLGSVLSDIEVDHLDIEAGKQFIKVPNGKARVGQMYDIAYQVLQTGESVVVSTTRPETILGDVAVAVHPNDPRYSSLLNRNVLLKHPLREDPIPLVADAEGVDPELGTGAVKITPNHDFNDFKVAQRLSLPTSVTIMDSKGNMTFPNETETPFQLTPDGKTFLVSSFLPPPPGKLYACLIQLYILIQLWHQTVELCYAGNVAFPSSPKDCGLFGSKGAASSSSRSCHVRSNLQSYWRYCRAFAQASVVFEVRRKLKFFTFYEQRHSLVYHSL